ncbi:thiamine phosphate synthase [Qipengyuania algicida]|uniref:thiamine phosphate synthase n=1 Tax=Qipengyuania algicida TaxID=1836209 RepID=UPI00301C86A7
MSERQTPSRNLPFLWLLSDARNDAGLEDALTALPPGSGFVFRHYHLDPKQRRRRFDHLVEIAGKNDHLVILARASWAEVAAWGADGTYAAPGCELGQRLATGWLLTTAHDEQELAAAATCGADGIFLSPVFPTRSHPDGEALGPERFLALANASTTPVIALGGMTRERAKALPWLRWSAIDGLSSR